MSYKIDIRHKTLIKRNVSTEGETIEMKIERIMSNKEPINDGAPLIYTERDEGVLPSYDIRTDRFDIAIDAMDIVHKTNAAKREEAFKAKKEAAEAAAKAAGTTGANEGTA